MLGCARRRRIVATATPENTTNGTSPPTKKHVLCVKLENGGDHAADASSAAAPGARKYRVFLWALVRQLLLEYDGANFADILAAVNPADPGCSPEEYMQQAVFSDMNMPAHEAEARFGRAIIQVAAPAGSNVSMHSFFSQAGASSEQVRLWHSLHRMFAYRPFVPAAESTHATMPHGNEPPLFLFNGAFSSPFFAHHAGTGHQPGAVLLKEAAASEIDVSRHAAAVVVSMRGLDGAEWGVDITLRAQQDIAQVLAKCKEEPDLRVRRVRELDLEGVWKYNIGVDTDADEGADDTGTGAGVAPSAAWLDRQQEMLAQSAEKEIGDGLLHPVVEDATQPVADADEALCPINLCHQHVDRTPKMQSMADILQQMQQHSAKAMHQPLEIQRRTFAAILSTLSARNNACGFRVDGPLSENMASMLPDFVEGLLDFAVADNFHLETLLLVLPVGDLLQSTFTKLLDRAVIKHNSGVTTYCMLDCVLHRSATLEESQDTQSTGDEGADCHHLLVFDNQVGPQQAGTFW